MALKMTIINNSLGIQNEILFPGKINPINVLILHSSPPVIRSGFQVN